MPRSLTITASNDAPIRTDLNVRRAETLRLTVTPNGLPMVMTISLTPGGDPLIEIPSEAGGSFFVISPEKVSTLAEGKKYQMNIWNSSDQDEPLLLVEGAFTTSATIQPNYVQYATQVFEFGKVVVLTQSEYEALPAPDVEITYVIVED